MVALTEHLEEERVTLRLLPHQMEAWTAAEPFVALCTGLGGGKTFTGARWIITRAVEFPDSIHLATGNSYRQLKDVVIPELLKSCEQLGIPYVWRKGDMDLFLLLGEATAEIRVRTTSNESVDHIRGAEYGSWWADEARDMSGYAADVVFGRLRCKHVAQVRMLWTTTPNGFDHIYERFVDRPDQAREKGAPVKYRLVRAASDANTFLREDYLDSILASYDEQTARQERLGEFVAMGKGQVYRAFDRRVHMGSFPYNPGLPINLCVDFNVDPMHWVLTQQVSGGEIHAIGEVFARNASISDATAVLASRYPEHSAGWQVYGDATGHARTNAGRTDYALMREAFGAHGIRNHVFRVPKSNPPVRDRVNAVNALLRNAHGQSRLFIDRSCTNLQKGLEQVVWDDSGTSIRKERDDKITHGPDALGYYVHAEHRPEVFRRSALNRGLA